MGINSNVNAHVSMSTEGLRPYLVYVFHKIV